MSVTVLHPCGFKRKQGRLTGPSGLLPLLRITFVLFVLTCVQVSAKGRAQNVHIVLKDAPMEKVITMLNKQSGYNFFYNKALLKLSAPVTIDLPSGTLSQALTICFEHQPLLTYTIVDKVVVIKKKQQKVQRRPSGQPLDLTMAASQADAQQPVIHGVVRDSVGTPVKGAAVLAVGSKKGTLTDDQGAFRIEAAPGEILRISYVGFETMSVTVPQDPEKEIQVVLSAKRSSLDDLIVVGYGTQKKVDLTGAVTSVKMDAVLEDRPVTSTSQALQGAVPGLQITSGSGEPGTSSDINIRGFTSINGGSPLVLVDNVPMDMDQINPKDIESVSVLKDAATSAIYGARAAFGVILITTKKGARNQPIRFNYSTNIALTDASTLPKKATPLQFVSALKDFGTTSYWSGEDIGTWLDLLAQYQKDPAKFPDGSATVDGAKYPLAQSDIYGKLFNQGFEQIHNFSFSGGSDKTSYRTSISYTDQNGVLVSDNDAYRRYSFNSSMNTQLSSALTASVSVQYNNDAKKTPKDLGSIFHNAITFGPYAATGEGVLPGTEQTLPYSSPNNIVSIESPTQDNSDLLRLFGKLDYTPIKNLKLSGEYTFTRSTGTKVNIYSTNQYVNPLTYQLDVINPTSSYYKYASATNDNALNLYATYQASIAHAHNFTLLVGTNQEQSKESGFSVSRLDLISSDVPSVSTSTGTTTGTDDFGEYAVSGYFGRFNYNYKNRYLFEATGRYDGSSRFPAGHRFGFFPAFSAGWNLMEEPFMASLKNTFQEVKLRGSYGEIGNQVITFSDGTQNYYPATPGLGSVEAPWINPATNIVYTSLATPTLVSSSFSWERVRTANIGIDMSILKNKLTGSFDLFKRQTLDMLAPGSQLPVTLGAPAPLQNAADLQVKGWELQLSWKDKIGKLSYYANFNLSDNHAEITRFDNPGGLLSQYYEGEQLNEIWGYVTQGYFSTADFESGSLDANLMNGKLLPGIAPFQGVLQNPGDIRFVDLNGDGVISPGSNTLSDPGDRKVIGNSTRRLQYGFSGGLSIGSIDFSFFLQGVGKRDLWISNEVFWPYLDQFGAIFEHQLNYWTADNTNGYYPRMYSNASGNTATSRSEQTKYLSNGAYMRIKNIQVGYTLPEAWMRKLTITSARIFFSGENLFTFDHLPDGMDPEATNLGTGGIYPFLKKYSFGININF